jgi:hypothetical protein
VHVSLLVVRHAAESSLLGNLARRTLSARAALGDEGALPTLFHATAEHDVARAVFGGEELPSPPRLNPPTMPAIEPCREWVRPARWVTRSLTHRRLLADRWRAELVAAHGPAMLVTRAEWLARGPGDDVVVFAVPLLDGTGAVVETRVVALSARLAASGDLSELIARATHRAAAVVAPRTARLERWRRARAAGGRRLEDALAADALGARIPAVQPGLFDRRALERAARDAAARRNVEAARGERLRGLSRASQMTAGQPQLLLVVSMGRRR